MTTRLARDNHSREYRFPILCLGIAGYARSTAASLWLSGRSPLRPDRLSTCIGNVPQCNAPFSVGARPDVPTPHQPIDNQRRHPYRHLALRPYRDFFSKIALFLLPLLLSSCLTRNDVPPTPERTPDKKALFERANQLSAAHTEMQIEGYIRREGLSGLMHDGRGMYYKVWGTPQGTFPKDGVRLGIVYSAELLDGTPCESADGAHPLEVIIGKRQQTVGLEELLLHVAPGQEALAIVPPHLAYGLVGKGQQIPPNATLVYKVKEVRYLRQ